VTARSQSVISLDESTRIAWTARSRQFPVVRTRSGRSRQSSCRLPSIRAARASAFIDPGPKQLRLYVASKRNMTVRDFSVVGTPAKMSVPIGVCTILERQDRPRICCGAGGGPPANDGRSCVSPLSGPARGRRGGDAERIYTLRTVETSKRMAPAVALHRTHLRVNCVRRITARNLWLPRIPSAYAVRAPTLAHGHSQMRSNAQSLASRRRAQSEDRIYSTLPHFGPGPRPAPSEAAPAGSAER
jgi:hypothetical protein